MSSAIRSFAAIRGALQSRPEDLDSKGEVCCLMEGSTVDKAGLRVNPEWARKGSSAV